MVDKLKTIEQRKNLCLLFIFLLTFKSVTLLYYIVYFSLVISMVFLYLTTNTFLYFGLITLPSHKSFYIGLKVRNLAVSYLSNQLAKNTYL